jgi:hypothetical protein
LEDGVGWEEDGDDCGLSCLLSPSLSLSSRGVRDEVHT